MRNDVLTSIVRQHIDDAAILHSTRRRLATAPRIALLQLRRHDDRIEAHLDGVAVAGHAARPLCEAALLPASPGAIFVVALRILEVQEPAWLQQLLAVVESTPECCSGLSSAFGWTGHEQLRGIVRELLCSDSALRRYLGVTACSLHRVDPVLRRAWFEDPAPLVRARAYRIAGELGKQEFISRLGAAVLAENSDCQFWAAWAAVLLGDRQRALDCLESASLQNGPFRVRAQQLALLAMTAPRATESLRSLVQDPAQIRWLIKGIALAGDPAFGPWLVRRMRDDTLARLAGEAFTLITGVDLRRPPFERQRPEGFESGPSDDTADESVAMEEDEDLPWPDPEQVQAWWSQNSGRFTTGVRHFMGHPVTREHCVDVLKHGCQRQRIAAAYHLCLADPGTPLFEWRAPARRQQRLLAEMS